MRKKTIEEELKEIREEKENHIKQLEKQFGHSDEHRYDFSPAEKSSRKTSERTYTVHGINVTKEEYEQWQKDFGKQDAKLEKKLSKAKSEVAKTKAMLDSAEEITTSNEAFTFDDYCRMIELEEKEQSDEEFEEYYKLMDRYAEAPNKEELENLYYALQDRIKEDDAAIEKLQNGIATVNEHLDDCKTHLNEIDKISKEIDKRSVTQSVRSHIIPIIVLCFFVIAGLSVTIFAGIIPWTKSVNYVPVTAKVEKIQDAWKDDGYQYAELLVSFEFNKEPHTAVINKRVESTIQAGVTSITIYVNKNNLNDIKANGNGNFIFPTIFGIVFAGLAIIMQTTLIVQVIKMKRNSA